MKIDETYDGHLEIHLTEEELKDVIQRIFTLEECISLVMGLSELIRVKKDPEIQASLASCLAKVVAGMPYEFALQAKKAINEHFKIDLEIKVVDVNATAATH